MLALGSELLLLRSRSKCSLPGSLIRAFLILSPFWGFQFDDRANMQRAPDRVATSRSFLAVRSGRRTIKLSARITPNVGKNIAVAMLISEWDAGSPGYDTTVAP